VWLWWEQAMPPACSLREMGWPKLSSLLEAVYNSSGESSIMAHSDGNPVQVIPTKIAPE
jgi:hypothetical protein